MKLKINHNNYVDFDAPVHMTEKQFSKFCEFVKNLVEEKVVIEEIAEKERVVGSTEKTQKKWMYNDYLGLLSSGDNHEVAKRLDRSVFSIIQQRAPFMQEFFSWAKENNFVISKDQDKRTQLAKKFLEYKKIGDEK